LGLPYGFCSSICSARSRLTDEVGAHTHQPRGAYSGRTTASGEARGTIAGLVDLGGMSTNANFAGSRSPEHDPGGARFGEVRRGYGAAPRCSRGNCVSGHSSVAREDSHLRPGTICRIWAATVRALTLSLPQHHLHIVADHAGQEVASANAEFLAARPPIDHEHHRSRGADRPIG